MPILGVVLLLSIAVNGLEIELPEVICSQDVMKVTFRNASHLSRGRVYVVGHEESERCVFGVKQAVNIPLLHCADIKPLNNDNNGLVKVNVYIRVTPHPFLITGDSKEFHLECKGLEKTSLYGNYNNPHTNTVCQHNVKTSGRENRLEEIIFHEWTCSEQYGIEDFIMWIREVTVISRRKEEVTVISNNGCTKDDAIISNLHPSLSGVQKITALSQFFKFPIENSFRIRTSIVLVPRIINGRVQNFVDCHNLDLRAFTDSVGSVSTDTMTDWISVEEENPHQGECPSLLINQELEPFNRINDTTESFLELLNTINTTGNTNRREFRINDVILNQLNQSVTMVMFKDQNRYDVTFPLKRKSHCSWHVLNTALLCWSIASVLVWMVQLSIKLYSYLAKEFAPPMPEDDDLPQPCKSWADPYKVNQNMMGKSADYLEFERRRFF
ncbi:unnamed protein product [Bursaphelenchus okinawaensis]|uniref:ZP domain-containing protein n=1 Tax=Bursaphelenchus okinawaensis TaxID=465554 RepID=A0A811KG13_9BILA|nr:unnamed protein product [Bursaphelenchus okinawaensis]CAG9103756.1 unnamed protein product [Bursaphelenchus okinawaensis]